MRIRKAVIPAAGFGTRFLPATKAQPKEMLTVIDKPLIQYSVEEAVSSGIENICVIISRGKSAIENHFDKNPELESFLEIKGKTDFLREVRRISDLAEFCYIRQKQALGLGHAILMAEKFIGDEPFAVLLPDDIFDCRIPAVQQAISIYEEYGSSVVILKRINKEETSKYGVIDPEKVKPGVFRLKDMIEKPGPERAFSDLGIIGRYVFNPDIFDAIKKTKPDHRGEIQITDAIKILLEKEPVYGYLFKGRRYDAGDKAGYIKATIELALKRPEFKKIIQDIKIE
ncbi:MAG: UTP--glucose-1-phosphate uridylyltransferase GalU [Candidatus Aminicenantes bacterium]|nr:UTP--glucose-1-phosphate uridylyltransferase GalU [Candidatus Aminicenantes bacterium]